MTLALDADWYRDPAYFALERRTIWWNEWIMIGVTAQLSKPGDSIVTDIAGWPVIATIGPSGEAVGFHNVCPHRAGVLAWPGQTTMGNLVCRYHGWAFGWDGALKSARDFGDEPGFCAGDHSLTPVSLATWGPLVFARLSTSGPSLVDSLGTFVDRCRDYPIESFTYGHRLVRDLRCNWKTYADNYLEGYHVSVLHPSLNRALDMSTYRVAIPDDGYCVHTCDTTEGSPSAGAWLFRYPNLAVNVYPNGMNVERIVPLGHDRTQVVYDYFAIDPTPETMTAMVELSNVVLDEDQAICEAVQRNLDAGIYHAGPLSPRHENALEWFQGRVRAEAR